MKNPQNTIQQLLLDEIKGLNELPNNPKVLWYSSGGQDFRPNVFLTNHHIENEKQHHGREFMKPDLYVYSCLGAEVQELKKKVMEKQVLFEDALTRIIPIFYQETGINREIIDLTINPTFIHSGHVPLPLEGKEAFYFEIEISSEAHGYHEIQKVLYLEHENNDTFHKIILTHFEVLYFWATREGLAWGNCKKSVMDTIYGEGAPAFFSDKSFNPKYITLLNNSKRKFFIRKTSKSEIFQIEWEYSIFDDFSICKLEYA